MVNSEGLLRICILKLIQGMKETKNASQFFASTRSENLNSRVNTVETLNVCTSAKQKDPCCKRMRGTFNKINNKHNLSLGRYI